MILISIAVGVLLATNLALIFAVYLNRSDIQAVVSAHNKTVKIIDNDLIRWSEVRTIEVADDTAH